MKKMLCFAGKAGKVKEFMDQVNFAEPGSNNTATFVVMEKVENEKFKVAGVGIVDLVAAGLVEPTAK
jgi:hypothetical protein